ncbi:nicotinate-nucleotide adenylyltransferase [Edaphobacter paludis]|uniref:Probable nicotinate-nucleotide adenylyltransferase n=1 Tax=Edaphobacter paludis TaxID=3035702 RepID=A0AAU7CYT2_9BACT
MRIALFGGTFDPPHLGHLAIARAAAEAFQLDTVLFAPAGRQPLKLDGSPSSFTDRLAMTTLACKQDKRFRASAIDAPRSDGLPNYTADTLASLRRALPEDTLFNLVGADSFLDLPRWHEPNRLLELAEWIVVSRPGFSLADFSREDLSSLHLTPHQQSRVHLLTTVHEDISATVLRQRLQAGESCTDALPSAVSTYIHTHHLYH